MKDKQRGFTLLEMLLVLALFAGGASFALHAMKHVGHWQYTLAATRSFLQGTMDYARAHGVAAATLLIGDGEAGDNLREMALLFDDKLLADWHLRLPKNAEILRPDDTALGAIPSFPGHWFSVAMENFLPKNGGRARIVLRLGPLHIYEIFISDNGTAVAEKL